MNDSHMSVIDMYDVNATSEEESGKPCYKAYETDRTQDRQLQIRIHHGLEEGETLLPYALIVKVKHRPLTRLLIDERLPSLLEQDGADYLLLREQLKQEVLHEINALETAIISLPVLEQIEEIQDKIDTTEQLLLFDTNSIHILEGRHLAGLLEPLQDAQIRNLHCYTDDCIPPANGEPIIVRISEYEFNSADTAPQNVE